MLDSILDSLEKKLKKSKEIIICDIKFEISLLTYEEEQLVSFLPKEEEEPLAFYEKTRAQVLSYSIKKINGVEIPAIVEIDKDGKKESKERSVYIRDDVLKKLPTKVVDILFDAYIDFKEEAESCMDKDVKYEWYKTPEQRRVEREKKVKEMKNVSETEIKSEEKEQPIVFKKIEESDDVKEK
ncbi:MAG: hypothetical protein N2511_06895 [Thermodesulfovibrionales bacterium]|nr:hypothetical protein [Thermodesulfovibrionales bacterium]